MPQPDAWIGRTIEVRLIQRGRCAVRAHTGIHALADDCISFAHDGSYEVDRTPQPPADRIIGDEGRLHRPGAIEVDSREGSYELPPAE